MYNVPIKEDGEVLMSGNESQSVPLRARQVVNHPFLSMKGDGSMAEIFRGDSVFYVVDLVMGDVFGAATFVLTVVPEAVQLCSSVAISVKPKRPPLFALQHWGHRSDLRGELR